MLTNKHTAVAVKLKKQNLQKKPDISEFWLFELVKL